MDISPDGDDQERDDYRVVVLKDRFVEAVARLNPDLPQSATNVQTVGLLSARFWLEGRFQCQIFVQ